MEARSAQTTADRHLVIARVTRRTDTRTLDLVLAWLGDISSAVAPVCRTPCTDSSWQAQLTAELDTLRRSWRWIAARAGRTARASAWRTRNAAPSRSSAILWL